MQLVYVIVLILWVESPSINTDNKVVPYFMFDGVVFGRAENLTSA